MISNSRIPLLIFAFLGVCFFAASVPAQVPPITAPVIEQAPLDPVVVFNSEGKRLLYLPGWNLNDLADFWTFWTKDQKNPLPPFNLQEISVTGKVVDNHVEAEIRITLTTFNNRPVIVPLGMKEGILPVSVNELNKKPDDKKPLYHCTGPGLFDLAVDPQSGHYLAILRPKEPETPEADESKLPSIKKESDLETAPETSIPAPDSPEKTTEKQVEKPANDIIDKADHEKIRMEQRFELFVSLWFPLNRIGNEENRLTISFPQAVSSLFVLNVPEKDITATVSQGSLLDPYDTSKKETTQFKIHGLEPDFELVWRKKKAEPIDDRPVLLVKEASIKAQLEPKSTVYDVILPVSTPSSGGFDNLRVRLPQSATLDRETTEKYAAGAYSFEQIKEESATAPLIEFRLQRKTSGPSNIRLKAIQQFETEKPDGWRDLGGFDVLGAEQQSGYLTVAIPADMRPSWKPIRGIRRTEIPESTPQEGIDARFEFFSQPFLLQGKIILPQPRTNVKPEYQIQINKGSLSLTARFSYEVLGAKTESLAIQLHGWKLNGDIKPANIIDTVRVEQDENGLLTIPLRTTSDSSSFEIELKADRPLSQEEGEGKQRLVVPLPQPVVTWSEPAPVVIVPADNVEVTPIDEDADLPVDPAVFSEVPEKAEPSKDDTLPKRTVGLTRRSRRSLPIKIEIPDRQQEPLFYCTEPVDAVFVSTIRYHRQKIAASMRTDIRLRDQSDQVDQVVSYNVSYVSVDKLYFLVPKAIEETGHLQVKLGNRSLELRDVASPVAKSDLLNDPLSNPGNWVRKLVILPESLFKFQLVFRYSIPQITIERDIMVPFSLSFIRPVDTSMTDHRVNMIIPPGYRIELHNDTNRLWNTTTPDVSVSGTTSFLSSQSPDRISLLVSSSDRDALGTMVIERAWLQTWLTGTLRQDRSVYLITSDRESIEMTLPPETNKAKKVFVYIDHNAVLSGISPKGELSIPLTLEQRRRSVLVEVIYQFPFEMTHRTVDLNLPHFGTDSLVRCEYWQILLPQHRHILGIPTSWTPEYSWAWNGLFLGRVPSLHKKDIGLPDDSAESLPIGTEWNQYLFSSIHPAAEASFHIVDRSFIVLFSSGLSLLIGLALIYFPRTRYAGSLFGLGIALLAIIFYRPAPVFLMLQASSFGVFLALGAGYVYRIVHREEKWVVPASHPWEDASEPSEVYSVIVDESDNKENNKEVNKESNQEAET